MATSSSTSTGPGRLGNPDMSLATDPRTHRGLLKGLEAHGMQHNAFLSANITPDAPRAELIAFARSSEHSLEEMIKRMNFEVHDPMLSRSITKTTTTIPGPDNNKINLIIYRPTDHKTPLPAILYLHGGGMVMLQTNNPLHTSYAASISQLGLICILIDFRNVLPSTLHNNNNKEESLHPFPQGLHDCISSVQYLHAHKTSPEFRISHLFLHGDSGGANLALATALKLNQNPETASFISGVFVIDPYISGPYAYAQSREWKLAHLPSLVECDGYDVSCSACAVYSRLYHEGGGGGEEDRNAFAWPFWADEEDLRGLPRHRVLVAELDPLRDEGRAFWRRLERAGVRVTGRVREGMTHTGELLLREYVGREVLEVLGDLKGFVEGGLDGE